MSLKKRERQTRDPNAVVVYLRVSTTDQAESGLSIPAQQRVLETYCRERGHVIEKVYVEPGAAAKDDQRPVFRSMIADVLAPASRVGAVVVYHSSRFMRNVLQAQAYKAKLKKHGVRVVSSQHHVSDNPQGRMTEQFIEAIDEYESEVNGARTSAAMAENARQGYFNGAKAPFGFMVEKVTTPSGSQKNKLVPNAMEADVLREVFRLYVGGAGAKATARDLNQRGVRYRKGALWSSDLVLKVIQEEAAIGTYYWGRRDHGVYRDKSEWIPSSVTPLIDDALFELARRVREERDPERNPGRASSSPLLLAKLLRCGRCGATCALETSGKLDANGEHTYRYCNCRAFIRVGKEACTRCRVPVALLDDAVMQHVGEQVFSTERCREFLRAFVEETGVLRTKTAEQRRQLEREVADIDGRIARWQEAFETGAEAFDVIAPRLRELKAKRDEVATVLTKLVPLRQVPPHLYADSTIKKFLATMHEVLTAKDSSIAKNYLRMLVETITVTPGPDDVAIDIAARTSTAVAMIAAGGGKDGLNQPERVLTTVGQWRPNDVPCENLRSAFLLRLPAAGRPRKSCVARVPRVVAFLEQAVEFERLLRTREVRFRAGLAARSGISAMRVTQILALTKLAPEVQDFVRSLPPGTPERRVTERSLRVLTTMPPEEQLLHASRHVPGFGGFLALRPRTGDLNRTSRARRPMRG